MKRPISASLLLLVVNLVSAGEPSGHYIDIAKSNMVANTPINHGFQRLEGNCMYASFETCARQLGITELYGSSKGRGGATADDLASLAYSKGVEYKLHSQDYRIVQNGQWVRDHAGGWKLIQESIASGCPVVFTIEGHGLVCNGILTDDKGQQTVYVIDNTGPEGCRCKGWSKDEFDAKFTGGVCQLCPRRGVCPGPNCPTCPPPFKPHVDPPAVVPPPVMPPAPTLPQPDVMGAIKALSDKIDKIQLTPGPPGPAGGKGDKGDSGDPADVTALRQQVALLQSIMERPWTVEIYNADGKTLYQRGTFGLDKPLQLRKTTTEIPK